MFQVIEFISMVGSCVIFSTATEMPQDPFDPFSAEIRNLILWTYINAHNFKLIIV